MMVWIWKYALTRGLYQGELVDKVYARSGKHGLTREWCATREEAATQAHFLRLKRIASLEKQLVKLKAKVFK